MADGRLVPADGVGSAYGMQGVLHVRASPLNLLSQSALLDNGFKLSVRSAGRYLLFRRSQPPLSLLFERMRGHPFWVLQDGLHIATSTPSVAHGFIPDDPAMAGPPALRDGSVALSALAHVPPSGTAAAANRLLLLHLRFGHANVAALRALIRHSMVAGLQLSEHSCRGELPMCEGCAAGKLHRLPFAVANPHRSLIPGAVWNVDVIGPISPIAVDGSRYVLLFTDDSTRYHVLFTLKNKTGVRGYLQRLQAEVLTPAGRQIVGMRCDSGSEFVNSEVRS